jgi:SprT protein
MPEAGMTFPLIAGPVRSLRWMASTRALEIILAHGLKLSTTGVERATFDHLRTLSGAALSAAVYRTTLDPHLRAALSPPQPVVLTGEVMSAVQLGLSAISHYLPPPAVSFVTETVRQSIPCLIRPVKARRTRHGDCTATRWQLLSEITISISGNAYQQLITTLHEIAHAEVFRRFVGTHPDPHGQEWRLSFQRLLVAALERGLFPDPLHERVRAYARHPRSSSSLDLALQVALRDHDTSDTRPLVGQLAEGTWFSLDGTLALRKGPIMRTRLLCEGRDGRRYRVHPSARVHTLYRPGV